MTDDGIMADIAFESGRPQPDPPTIGGLSDSDRNVLDDLSEEWKEQYGGCDECGIRHEDGVPCDVAQADYDRRLAAVDAVHDRWGALLEEVGMAELALSDLRDKLTAVCAEVSEALARLDETVEASP